MVGPLQLLLSPNGFVRAPLYCGHGGLGRQGHQERNQCIIMRQDSFIESVLLLLPQCICACALFAQGARYPSTYGIL
jgi:hypothetical protein